MKDNQLTKEKIGFKSIIKCNFETLYGTNSKTKKGIAVKSTIRIAYLALLTAIATLCNAGSIFINRYFTLSFIGIPCFIAGIMLGPISGFAVGFLGDLLGSLIAPQGPYMPMIGIASGLYGLIPGVIFLLFKMKPELKITISYILCLIICTCGLNTVSLWLTYSKGEKTLSTFWIYLELRLPFQIAVAAINWFLTTVLYECLAKAKIIKKPIYKNLSEPITQ